MLELIDLNGATSVVCADCGEPFAHSERERNARGGSNVPLSTRCPACREQHRTLVNARRLASYDLAPVPAAPWAAPGPDATESRLFAATCVECGRGIRLPFKPAGDRPIFCRACYSIRHGR